VNNIKNKNRLLFISLLKIKTINSGNNKKIILLKNMNKKLSMIAYSKIKLFIPSFNFGA